MTGRPPTCICGSCQKCKHRELARERWRSMSLEERREVIARRDPEKVRAADRARYYRQREERLARMKEWAARNHDRVLDHSRSWAEANKHKRRAHGIVGSALRSGKLTRLPCEVCGSNENVHAHHDDYDRPLDVRWLCPTHHGEVHRVYREEAA